MDHSSVNQESSVYQEMLRYVLRKQIQSLINQLFDETGDETFVLSANVIKGSVTPLSSEKAQLFIRKETELIANFLDFLQIDRYKETAHRKVYSTRRRRGKRTKTAMYETDEIPSPSKLARPANSQTIKEVSKVSSISFADINSGLISSKSFSTELSLESTDVPETLEMNAYTEDEQTDLLKREENKSDMSGSQKSNETNVSGDQESKSENTVYVNIEYKSVVKKAFDSALSQLENNSVVNTNVDDLNADTDDIEDFVILKTEPDDLESEELKDTLHKLDNAGITSTVSNNVPVLGSDGTNQIFKTVSSQEDNTLLCNTNSSLQQSNDVASNNNAEQSNKVFELKSKICNTPSNLEGSHSEGNSSVKQEIEVISNSTGEQNIQISEEKSKTSQEMPNKEKTTHAAKTIMKKEYECFICYNKFRRRYNLDRHVRVIHAEIKKYTCSDCDKTFAYQFSLKTHLSKVHGVGPKFNCNYCQKVFHDRGNFRQHQQACNHQSERLPCTVCGKKFKTNDSFRQHKKYAHTERPVNQCDLCGKTFARPQELRRHINGKRHRDGTK